MTRIGYGSIFFGVAVGKRLVVLSPLSFLLSLFLLSLGALIVIPVASAVAAPAASTAPSLRPQGTAKQLVVDGHPFLMLGGELGNSTASSPASLDAAWPKLQALHLNTVLSPVYWELVEPTEGKLDFSSVDRVITQAREHGAARGPALVRKLEEQHVQLRAGVGQA